MSKKTLESRTFNAKQFERPGLSEDEIMEIKEAFDMFDTEERGYINPKELKEAMQSLGLDERNRVIYEMISNIDEEVERLDFKEFLELMTARLSEKDSREDIKKVFKLFDEDSKGYITIANLKRVTKDLGEATDDIELQEMIERADADGDGRVTFEDFYNIMTKKTFI